MQASEDRLPRVTTGRDGTDGASSERVPAGDEREIGDATRAAGAAPRAAADGAANNPRLVAENDLFAPPEAPARAPPPPPGRRRRRLAVQDRPVA
jgi:hypothetical protein